MQTTPGSIAGHPSLGFQTTMDLARDSAHGVKRKLDLLTDQQTTPMANRYTSKTTHTNDFKRPSLRPKRSGLFRPSSIRPWPASAAHQENSASLYSQRAHHPSTPTAAQDPLLSLAHPAYGLPELLVRNFVAMGIQNIYPWQSRCLLARGLLTGEKNLVYTAPTGGGKSLVADVLMLKRIIEEPGKKALLVLPFVALVQEKLSWLRRAVQGIERQFETSTQGFQSRWRRDIQGHDNSVRVAGYFGGVNAKIPFNDVDVAVCTIEKANSIVNTAIEQCNADSLAVVVVDEMHMLDDHHRGYLLELLTTKLLTLEQSTQIIGMSATMPNTATLAEWLNAKYYESKYRPIPIEEFLVVENFIYPASSSKGFIKTAIQLSQATTPTSSRPDPARTIDASEYKELSDPTINSILALTNETVRGGYRVLVFCNSRRRCELDAELISESMPGEEEVSQDLSDLRRDLMNELRHTAVGLDGVLERTIPMGVAYHHAGLTTEERDLISAAFDTGSIKVIVATCSLAAGVNLPARRVILHGARMGRDLVGPAMLRQMRGRAGRKGKDEIGEAFLCCQKSDLDDVIELMNQELPNIESALTPEKRGIKRTLLEVIATRLATTRTAVDEYMKHTLLYYTLGVELVTQSVTNTLQELLDDSLIELEEFENYKATQLGQAIVSAALNPDDGIFIHREIRRALQAFVMDSEMHVFYMFTPVQTTGLTEVNWDVFLDELDAFDESGQRVFRQIGIKPTLVSNLAHGGVLEENTRIESETARIHQRFYLALQLRDLCNEMSVSAVASKYKTARGSVQTLAVTCHGFAAGMIQFCKRLDLGMLAAVLEHMNDRLKAGARADLLDLAQVTYVKSRTARVFWDNGLRNLNAVAAADPADLVPILAQAAPKKVKLRDPEEAMKYKAKLKAKAEIIVQSAGRLLDLHSRFEEGE